MGYAALLSSSSATHRHRHRQRERGRHAFPPALTFAITFYSAVVIGHTCHAALASSVNPLFLSVATAVYRVLGLRARDCHPERVSARTIGQWDMRRVQSCARQGRITRRN